MKIEELDQDSLKGVLAEYVTRPDRLSDLFSYMPSEDGWLKKRSAEVSKRSFTHKEDLIQLLAHKHSSLPHNQKCLEQLHKLEQENSLVVVGGQQAGLLTGPLFTVYKAMSVIMLAKQYEEELGQPVVPLFWIAGEDHDLDEIRFAYTSQHNKWKKRMLVDQPQGEAATTKELPKKELNDFINHVFSTLPETDFTSELKAKVDQYAGQAVTYTDFFQLLMHEFFQEEGLLYLDSGDPALREIEKPFLRELVEKVESVQNQQLKGERDLQEKGYPAPIATDEENAHLFYTIDRKRSRLDYAQGYFYVRETDLTFTREELLIEVDAHPERFSNNVVTRPLMQEWLLPTAAFVAGPGELAYWATLKPVFEEFGFDLTPVIPRLSATFVPRQVEKHLRGRDDKIQSYIDGRGVELREAWLDKQHTFAIEEISNTAAQQIEEAHLPLRQLATEISSTVESMAEKNKEFIQTQIQFLKERMQKEIRMRHGFELDRYNEAIHWLNPLGYPQERMLHPFVLLNLAGSDIFTRMMSETPPLTSRHLVYYL